MLTEREVQEINDLVSRMREQLESLEKDMDNLALFRDKSTWKDFLYETAHSARNLMDSCDTLVSSLDEIMEEEEDEPE